MKKRLDKKLTKKFLAAYRIGSSGAILSVVWSPSWRRFFSKSQLQWIKGRCRIRRYSKGCTHSLSGIFLDLTEQKIKQFGAPVRQLLADKLLPENVFRSAPPVSDAVFREIEPLSLH